MRTKILLICATTILAACGHSSSDGWKTNDLRYIPLFETDENLVYVDLSTGQNTTWGSYGSASLFYNDYAIVLGEGGCCFMDKNGRILNERSYYDATIFHDDLAWIVEPGGPPVAIDKKGAQVFKFPQADQVFAFHEGVAVFKNAEGLCGLVDKKGKVVVNPIWKDSAPMVVNGMIAFKNDDNKWALADIQGKTITGFFDEIGSEYMVEAFLSNYVQALSEGRIPVKSADKWGVIDKKGTYIINPQFDDITLDGPNYLFKKARSFGWCDKDGQYIINPQFDATFPFNGQKITAAEDKNGDWGFIDTEGKWVINPQFRDAMPFIACGIAPAKDKDSRDWGAIDKTGKWVINPQFSFIRDFGIDDRFLVSDQSNKFGVIDASGKYIVSPTFVTAPIELIKNLAGLGPRIMVQSDFVDLAAVVAVIDSKINSLKATTTGGLMKTYELTESKFPKGGGDVTFYDKYETPEIKVRISVAGINAWNKASDGWFGYNYSFIPSVPINSYTMTVELYGKTSRFVEEIFEEIKKKYAYNQEQNTLSVPGYAPMIITSIPGGGFILQVQPQ